MSAPERAALPPEVVRVAVALLARDGRFLLRRRPPGSHLENLWEFPGGKLEPDESWDECLRREVGEELGARVRVGRLRHERTFDYPDRRVHLRFFEAQLEPGEEPRSLEEAAPIAWLTPAQILERPIPEANRELVTQLASAAAGPLDRRSAALEALLGALVLSPVAFVAAAVIFMTLDAGHYVGGKTLGTLLEERFPLLVVSGDRSIFLGVFVVLETTALVASIARVARRRSTG